MPREKLKTKMMKHRIARISRVIACASFLILAVIGVSSLARAMSLENVENQNGIPSSWQVASLGSPETITVPITYWDQRQESCDDPNRQFEWSECQLYAKGIIPNVVKSRLGTDGLPVPTYTNNKDAYAAYHDVFTANVIGNDPVQTTDNFYRWFHEAYDANGKQISKQIDREITFNKVKGTKNSYTYGSHGIFPIDDVDFSKDDHATSSGHNFHFTAHLQIPMKISADGTEEFHFLGDDDVWVFLNGQLVLDLGGLHAETAGFFKIDKNGNVQSTVNNVNVDQACRQTLPNPLKIGNSIYNSQLESKCQRKTANYTINTGFKPGDIVNLDFFYAERSTTESNTTITITNMNWPISADSDVTGTIVGKVEDKNSNLIQYDTYVKNRDPKNPLTLNRLSSYISDKYTNADSQEVTNSGYIPLSVKTLQYTTTPNDDTSWQPIEISAPMNSLDGFTLATPLTMTPSGQAGDTLYFRFVAETSEYSGTITNTTAYYTELNGVSGVTYDHNTLTYTGKTAEEDNTYDLKIQYVIDFGDTEPDDTKAPEDYHATLKEGDDYSVTTPTLEGFTPDYKIVEGTIGKKDVTITVTYTRTPKEDPDPIKHKVTIHYVKDDGSKAFDDYVGLHEEGEKIHIPSEELEHYTYSDEFIELTVPDEDVERTVRYTPIKHTVTVHYIYANGDTAHEDYVNQYGYGEIFSIISPDITGYHKDIAEVSGTMGDNDRTFTVTYTANNTPIVPDQPDQPNPPIRPTDPETPDTPITPNVPEENDNLIPSVPILPGDDDLTYLPPLGEVAYVPNTGVISDFIAPIFEQYFAEMILSQGFVLTMLLIFAGSFAAYFSLRHYMSLSTVARVSVPKKMPRNLSTTKPSKSAKMAKNAKTTKAVKTSNAKTRSAKTATKKSTKRK